MPQSMTGFGAGHGRGADVEVAVELRSINHKHLDLRCRVEPAVVGLADLVSERLRHALGRGHVDATVRCEVVGDAGSPACVDIDLARAWHRQLVDLAASLGVVADVGVAQIASLPGVLSLRQADLVLEDIAEPVEAALQVAIEALLEARRGEGRRLADDLIARVDTLADCAAAIAATASTIVDDQRIRLSKRVDDLLAKRDVEIDRGRLEAELVIFADRTDVTEELVRLDGHLVAFRAALTEEDQPGRRLGFLAQELLREINTIGSKSSRLEITEQVVAAKIEVERLREQIANLA